MHRESKGEPLMFRSLERVFADISSTQCDRPISSRGRELDLSVSIAWGTTWGRCWSVWRSSCSNVDSVVAWLSNGASLLARWSTGTFSRDRSSGSGVLSLCSVILSEDPLLRVIHLLPELRWAGPHLVVSVANRVPAVEISRRIR